MLVTPNYKLELYESTDKPNLRDQYNSSMNILDAQLLTFNNDVVSINNQITGINRDVTQLLTDNETNKTNIGTLNTKVENIETLQGQHSTEIGQLNDEMEGLGITSVSGAESFLATVNSHTTAIERNGELITTATNTADQALALAKTNESDIAMNDADIAGMQWGPRKEIVCDTSIFEGLTVVSQIMRVQIRNDNKEVAIGYYADIKNNSTTAVGIKRMLIPGVTGATGAALYGIKIAENTGLPSTYIPYALVTVIGDYEAFYHRTINAIIVGSDGAFYIHPQSASSDYGISPNKRIEMYIQYSVTPVSTVL